MRVMDSCHLRTLEGTAQITQEKVESLAQVCDLEMSVSFT